MAMSEQEVKGILDTLEQTPTARINNFLMGEGQPIKDAIEAHHAEIIRQRAGFEDHEQRMNIIVMQFNSTTSETVAEVSRQQLKLSEQQNQASIALNETQMLDSRLTELASNMAQYAEGRDALVGELQVDSRQLRTDTEFEFNKLKSEIEKWFEFAKAHIDG